MQNQKYPNRESIRLKEYDYSQAGGYFVTICTNNQEALLTDNDIKAMIFTMWQKLAAKFENVSLDEFVIMPNHVHGIIFLNDPESRAKIRHGSNKPNKNIAVGADPCVCPPQKTEGEHMGSPLPTIGRIVQWFKTMTTNEYIKGIKNKGWKPFNNRFWQRNYYEHVIRNDEDLRDIREYVVGNPLKWEFDENNKDK